MWLTSSIPSARTPTFRLSFVLIISRRSSVTLLNLSTSQRSRSIQRGLVFFLNAFILFLSETLSWVSSRLFLYFRFPG
jgi:hypothetical protein